MKDFRNKLLAGIFTFTIGVTAFYLVSKLMPEIFDVFYTNSESQTLLPEIQEVELFDRIEIRFIKFFKDNDGDVAQFEVTNNTSQNAYYRSYSKNSYPFPKLKRDGSKVETYRFHCGKGDEEQTLMSGETVIFSVPKSEITSESTKDSRRETDEPTQFGFPIQIGESGFLESRNKEETYFWSEEIRFPN